VTEHARCYILSNIGFGREHFIKSQTDCSEIRDDSWLTKKKAVLCIFIQPFLQHVGNRKNILIGRISSLIKDK